MTDLQHKQMAIATILQSVIANNKLCTIESAVDLAIRYYDEIVHRTSGTREVKVSLKQFEHNDY